MRIITSNKFRVEYKVLHGLCYRESGKMSAKIEFIFLNVL